MFGDIGHMNWKETPNAHPHVYEFELPGVSKDDIKLELHQGRVLRVSGERKDDDEFDISKDERWHCMERLRAGSFTWQFRLPNDAKVDDIKASMSNGVLVVTVPKDHKNTNHRREVHISDVKRHGPKGFGKFVCCKA